MAEIKLVLIGQIYNKEGGYAYLSSNTSEREEWLKGVNDLDPRSVRDNLSLKDQKVPTFSMWENEMGWYYGISAFNPYDSRMGHAMVVLYLGHHVPTDGALWERQMKNLLDKFITVADRKDVNDKEVEDLLVELNNSIRVVKKSATSFSSNISATNGYCVYENSDDLYNRWLYPMQRTQYATVRRLFIISKENLDGAKVTTWQNITRKPDKYYSIVNPDSAHVSVDKSHAVLGETILITYKKENAGESTQSVKVEHTSPYFTLDKQTLILKSLREVEGRISFSKKVLFEVVSKTGQSIKGFTLSIGGKQYSAPYGVNTLSVPLTAGKHKLAVVMTGYKKYETDFDMSKYMHLTSPKSRIELEPSLTRVSLSVRYEGREYFDSVYVNGDSELYTPLNEMRGETLRREKAGSWFNVKTIIIASITLVLGAAIGCLVGTKLGKGSKTGGSGGGIVITESPEEKKDAEYLTKNKVWKLDELTSDFYKSKFNALEGGDHSIFNEASSEDAKAIYQSLEELKELDARSVVTLLEKYEKQVNLATLRWEAEEKLEEKAKEVDKEYLSGHTTWTRSELKSKRYKNGFMDGVKDGNVTGLLKQQDSIDNNTWHNICRLLPNVPNARDLIKTCYDVNTESIDLHELKNELKRAHQTSSPPAQNPGKVNKTKSQQNAPKNNTPKQNQSPSSKSNGSVMDLF